LRPIGEGSGPRHASLAEDPVDRQAVHQGEAEGDRIRERIATVKADQKARKRYLGGKVPFGYRVGDAGELVEDERQQEAIREMKRLREQLGLSLRDIAADIQGRGFSISHEGVAEVLRRHEGHVGSPDQ
jgi:putative DNA-invertase from lambdoid prophage Rac